MRFFPTYLTLLAVVLSASVSRASGDDACFATIEIQVPAGHALHAEASDLAMRSPTLTLVGDGFVVTVTLPKDVRVGDTLELPATLQAAEQLQRGTLTLDVREAGVFLTGGLSGSFGPLTISGGLHVKRLTELPAAARLSTVSS